MLLGSREERQIDRDVAGSPVDCLIHVIERWMRLLGRYHLLVRRIAKMMTTRDGRVIGVVQGVVAGHRAQSLQDDQGSGRPMWAPSSTLQGIKLTCLIAHQVTSWTLPETLVVI